MSPHSKIGTKLNSTVVPYVKRVYEKRSSKYANKWEHRMSMNVYTILCGLCVIR